MACYKEKRNRKIIKSMIFMYTGYSKGSLNVGLFKLYRWSVCYERNLIPVASWVGFLKLFFVVV